MTQRTLSVIYATFGTKDDAEKTIQQLLEKKVIACANCFAPVTSYYEWDGAQQKEQEVVVLFKTSSARVSDVLSLLEGLSSYETPCAFELKTGQALSGYLSWVRDMTEVKR